MLLVLLQTCRIILVIRLLGIIITKLKVIWLNLFFEINTIIICHVLILRSLIADEDRSLEDRHVIYLNSLDRALPLIYVGFVEVVDAVAFEGKVNFHCISQLLVLLSSQGELFF